MNGRRSCGLCARPADVTFLMGTPREVSYCWDCCPAYEVLVAKGWYRPERTAVAS